MRNLILIMLLFVTTLVKAQSPELLAFNTETPKIELNLDKVDMKMVPPAPQHFKSSGGSNGTGLGMIIAGSAFTIGGLASNPEVYGYNGDNKKFFDNPARAGAVIGGVLLLSTGIVITLASTQ